MKKSIVGFTLFGWLFALLTAAAFILFPLIPAYAPIYAEPGILAFFKEIVAKTPAVVVSMFQFDAGIGISHILFYGFGALTILLFLIHLIFVIRNRRPGGLWVAFSFLLLSSLFTLILVFSFFPNLINIDGIPYEAKTGGVFGFIWGLQAAGQFNMAMAFVAFVPFLTAAIYWVLILIADVRDMVFLSRNPSAPRKDYSQYLAEGDRVVVVGEGDNLPAPSTDEIRDILRNELDHKEGRISSAQGVREFTYGGEGEGTYRGPILVQYINTGSGEAHVEKMANKGKAEQPQGDVPLSEVKAAITGEAKPLTADDIRKIFQEEFQRQKEAEKEAEAAKKEEEKPEEKEEVRAEVNAPLNNTVPEAVPENVISQDDIKNAIQEELTKFQQTRDAFNEEKARLLAEKEHEIRVAEEEARRLKAEKEAAEEALRNIQSQELDAARREVMAETLSEAQVTEIIARELAKTKTPEPQASSGVSAEDLRAIIRSEFASMRPEEKKEQPVVFVSVPQEMKKEEPVVVEEPKKRVVGAINPDLPPHDKIIRIPFPTRMLEADDQMKSNYNELKSEILAYGAKSRVSNSGDTFRLHKVTFVKIAIAGKSLKLYLALDPKDYADSPLPIQDVSHKNIYADIPLVFKVKSELSMRRAKQLISDVMEKNGLEQGKVKPNNWVDALKDYKPTGAKEDAEEEEE